MPIHPGFTVGARIPEAMESAAADAEIEQWCELVVTIAQDEEAEVEIQLTRAGGEAILEVVNQALHPYSGATIREKIWEALDDATETLMAGKGDAVCKGQAQGLALALAIFMNPYTPRVDIIREEAMERWEAVAAPQDSDDGLVNSVAGQEKGADDLPFG